MLRKALRSCLVESASAYRLWSDAGRASSKAGSGSIRASSGPSSQDRVDRSDKSLTEYDLVETDHSLLSAKRLEGPADDALHAFRSPAVGNDRSSSEGFLVNNVTVEGALLAYQHVWMMWNVKSIDEVTPESLEFLRLIRPAPDLVILGSGAQHVQAPRATLKMLKDMGVNMEILSTVRAIEYFNLLNQEQRSVVAFLLPEV